MKQEKITIELINDWNGCSCELTGWGHQSFMYDAIIALSKLIPKMAEYAQVNDDHWQAIIMAVIESLESYLGINKENREEAIKTIRTNLEEAIKKELKK